jgi:hypothetical protein
VHTLLESEFEKRCDQSTKFINRESFQACLRSVQDQFDFYSIAGSPLGVGLFEVSCKERHGGQSVMSISEYASAMAVLFNSLDTATQVGLTSQAILKWFILTTNPAKPPSALTDDVLVAFFEASWKFAWRELTGKLLSHICLNGKAETEAIERFSETHVKFFSTRGAPVSVGGNPPVDRTIIVSVGDESIMVPTSFSFLSKQRKSVGDTPPNGFTTKSTSAYPDL